VLLFDLRGDPPGQDHDKAGAHRWQREGIDHLDWIFADVKKFKLADDAVLTDEIMKRVKKFNYVPAKKAGEYAVALLAEYKKKRS